LKELLRVIAESTGAFGCILWEVAPGSDLESDPPSGMLYVLAEWFPDDIRCMSHDLPIAGSRTGKAVISGRTQVVPDVREPRAGVYLGDLFLSEHGISSLCSVKVTFLDGSAGAVNVYRRDGSQPFSDGEVSKVELLASFVPSLYRTIRDRVGYELLVGCERILGEGIRDYGTSASSQQVTDTLALVAEEIQEQLSCMEVSFFLEDPFDQPGCFQLASSTLRVPDELTKTEYTPGEEHLTSWVLRNARPVVIFDLRHFGDELEWWHEKYPGLKWGGPMGIEATVRRRMDLDDRAPLPPLSIMATPVTSASKLLGVLRCCTSTKPPYYFAERELELISLVAAQVGRFWNVGLSRRELERENDSWRKLAENIGEMNGFVQAELGKPAPDERRIFKRALEITHSLIQGAEITDVRLLDGSRSHLYYAVAHGDAWNRGTKEKIKERKSRKFSLADGGSEPKSAGAYVVRSRAVYEIPDVHSDPYYDGPFEDTTWMIIAPIVVATELYGVLDIRGVQAQSYPRNATAIADLLARQLGLYRFLADTIGMLRRTKRELTIEQNEQAQTYQDLAHQLKSPIYQAQARAQALLSANMTAEQGAKHLRAIRGLCRKAKRVTANTALFAALATEKPVTAKRRSLDFGSLRRMLIESSMDHAEMVDPRRDLEFKVLDDSLDHVMFALRDTSIFLDHDLLEQAVNELLDNASKYSASHTVIRVMTGMTGSGNFQIVVSNRGLPIHPEDVKNCTIRGWRGVEASLTSGEGSGIGLWIVHHIMLAHRGFLEIVPTTGYGTTSVKLVFPRSRKGEV